MYTDENISKAMSFEQKRKIPHARLSNRHYIGESDSSMPNNPNSMFSSSSDFDHFPVRSLFYKAHGMFASEYNIDNVSSEGAESFISKNKKNIIGCNTYFSDEKNREEPTQCALCINKKEKIFLYIINENGSYRVWILFSARTKMVNKIIDYFISARKKEVTLGNLSILVAGYYGIGLAPYKIAAPVIDFDLNYNPDFKPVQCLIEDSLSSKHKKGLILLHGDPGTGKTTYIRHLINTIEKKIIYIPPNMSESISDPSMIKFLLHHTGSVLIIEDAENVLTKRSGNSKQAVSNILNLTDGLLSDVVGIQIVATFNTSVLNIDDALTRKGRLIARYEFKKLNSDLVEKISVKLGKKITGAHTLSDIYNLSDKSFAQEKNGIGFKRK